jgi:hypothetical protein
MYLIAHRGNVRGRNEQRENTEDYILECLESGYDCEIDVWVIDNEIFLGHDYPCKKTSLEFCLKNKDHLWIHCKNSAALHLFINEPVNCFYHDKDDYTITSKGIVWGNIDSKCVSNMICVMPEKHCHNTFGDFKDYIGVCSDYISHWKDNISKKKMS